jgi:hypothetical protein
MPPRFGLPSGAFNKLKGVLGKLPAFAVGTWATAAAGDGMAAATGAFVATGGGVAVAAPPQAIANTSDNATTTGIDEIFNHGDLDITGPLCL